MAGVGTVSKIEISATYHLYAAKLGNLQKIRRDSMALGTSHFFVSLRTKARCPSRPADGESRAESEIGA